MKQLKFMISKLFALRTNIFHELHVMNDCWELNKPEDLARIEGVLEQ